LPGWQLAAVVGVAATITLALALEFRRRTTLTDLAAVGLIVISLLSIPLNLYLPGGSFVTVWAGLFLTAALAAAMFLRPADWRRVLICASASLPVVFVVAPLTLTLFVALTLRMSAALAPAVVLTTWWMISSISLGIEGSEPDRATAVGEVPPT
jgi:hypothetical protein